MIKLIIFLFMALVVIAVIMSSHKRNYYYESSVGVPQYTSNKVRFNDVRKERIFDVNSGAILYDTTNKT